MTRILSGRSRLFGVAVVIAALVLAGCTSSFPRGATSGAPAGIGAARASSGETSPASESVARSQVTTYAAEWHQLWQEHVTWSRTVMLGVVNGLPGASLASARLDHNATAMEQALSPYTSKQRAQRFAALMQEHALIEASMLRAMKAGEDAAADEAEKEWFANGYAIAALLNRMAPSLSIEEVDEMFKAHLAATKREAEDRMGGDYEADIVSCERVQRQAGGMADAMARAIEQAADERSR